MAQYSKEELYSYTRKLYKLFREYPEIFTLKKLRGVHGWVKTISNTDNRVDIIALDYRANFVYAIIHEALHAIYPEMSETGVTELSHNLLNQFSVRQIKNLLKKFAEVLQ